MGEYTFKLPDIGEGIAESEVAEWKVAVGDTVEEDQPLVDMLTEKAAVEIPSPVGGKVLKLHAGAGDKVAVGDVLITIELPEGAAAPATRGGKSEAPPPEPPPRAEPAPQAQSRPEPAAAAAPSPPKPAAAPPSEAFYNPMPAAAPSVRRRARELGLDLHRIQGSGKGGRILHQDLFSPPHEAKPSPAAGGPDVVEEIKLIGMRRKIAESMERSKRRIPHFAYVEELDVTELEALRVHLNATYGATRGKLTLLPFLIRALMAAVPATPQVNSTYDEEKGIVSRHSALHVGIATQTPNGLLVPVVRHAERLDLWECAAEISRLAAAARESKATLKELTGSTITITSLGKMGGIVSTPVINAPEVAILGVNKMVQRPVVYNGQVTVRTMMNLSSSFDHRIVDGYDAATFIQRIKGLLEHPATLYLPA